MVLGLDLGLELVFFGFGFGFGACFFGVFGFGLWVSKNPNPKTPQNQAPNPKTQRNQVQNPSPNLKPMFFWGKTSEDNSLN